MVSNFNNSNSSEALSAELELWKSEKLKIFVDSLLQILTEMGNIFIEMGIMERDYPLVYQSFKEYSEKPEDIMETLVDSLEEDIDKIKIKKAFLQFFILVPKFSRFNELSPDEKIDLGKKLKNISIILKEEAVKEL